MQCKHTRTHTQTHTHTHSHYGFCKDSKENICFESITSHIFIFLSPAVIISPCQTNQKAETERRLGERLILSTVRFTNVLPSQTGSVRGDVTWVCVCASLPWDCVSVCVCVCVINGLMLIFLGEFELYFTIIFANMIITLKTNHQ